MRFARPDTLLGLDYDGTLAPIRRRRDAAYPARGTHQLLREVSLRYQTLVITGRARSDARRLLGDMPQIEIIGNHGIESTGARLDGLEARIRVWRGLLHPHLDQTSGIEVEDKRYSLAVHYRGSRRPAAGGRRPAAAYAAICAAAAELPGAKLVTGKAVLNILPREAPHKGAALLAACARRGCKRAIYIGDDDTDEDVFALDKSGKILTVRVGYRRASRAHYYVRERSDIDMVLKLLLSGDPGTGLDGSRPVTRV
ncbi:MAG TPA: trehalose-phosphatase [Gammaproteobacteria bacterium]